MTLHFGPWAKPPAVLSVERQTAATKAAIDRLTDEADALGADYVRTCQVQDRAIDALTAELERARRDARLAWAIAAVLGAALLLLR